jgi:hypothetical protein
VNEHVDLATVKFHRETAKASAPSCAVTTHSACGGFPSDFGFDGHTVGRLFNHPNVLSDDYCSAIVPDCIGCRTLYGNGNIGMRRPPPTCSGNGAGSAVWHGGFALLHALKEE